MPFDDTESVTKATPSLVFGDEVVRIFDVTVGIHERSLADGKSRTRETTSAAVEDIVVESKEVTRASDLIVAERLARSNRRGIEK